jgi:hypothetical protein
MRGRLVAIAVGLAAATPALAQELPPQEHYGVRVEYREFRPDITGFLQKTTADELTLENDLLASDDRTFEVRGAIQFKPGHKLRGGYLQIDLDGTNQIPRTVNYGDTRFVIGTELVTSVKGAVYAAGYEFDFVKRPTAFLGLELGGRALDTDVVVVAPGLGLREQDTVQVVLPSVGAIGRAYLGKFSIEGGISGFSLGDTGKVFEAEASLRFHLSDRIAAQGGYRLLNFQGQDSGTRVKVDYSGFQFGGEVSF